jgi:hypothetical protein
MTTEILVELILESSVLDDLVTGCDETVVYMYISRLSLHNLGPIVGSVACFFVVSIIII